MLVYLSDCAKVLNGTRQEGNCPVNAAGKGPTNIFSGCNGSANTIRPVGLDEFTILVKTKTNCNRNTKEIERKRLTHIGWLDVDGIRIQMGKDTASFFCRAQKFTCSRMRRGRRTILADPDSEGIGTVSIPLAGTD